MHRLRCYHRVVSCGPGIRFTGTGGTVADGSSTQRAQCTVMRENETGCADDNTDCLADINAAQPSSRLWNVMWRLPDASDSFLKRLDWGTGFEEQLRPGTYVVDCTGRYKQTERSPCNRSG